MSSYSSGSNKLFKIQIFAGHGDGSSEDVSEVRGAERPSLYQRPYIGDGDSEGFSAVRNAAPYGKKRPVTKEKCIGHVQKRVGNNLMTLKKNLKGIRKNLPNSHGIFGRGRLIDSMIDRLQTYYDSHGNIRRSGKNVQLLARNIWAALGVT